MKIQIIQRACGGTEFLPQPSRLHLGAQNAEGVDRLQFQLPESWADCAIALYLRRSDGTQLAPVPLDGDACVTVDRRLTGCTGGQWMLAAVSGSGYTAYTRPGRYDTYATLPPATADQLGGVKVGDYLDVDEDGTLSGKTLNDKIAAAVAVKSEARLVWNTHVTSPNKFTTWDVQIPGNVDKICITKGKYNSYDNNTEKSIARGGTTTYDCNINFTITFQTNGILHVVSPYKTVFPLELWIDGYHYPTLADLLTQVTAVESSVTDLQVALCELYEEKEEN